MAHEFDVSQQQVKTNGDPNLRHYRILGGADETFNLQVLLDPLEEEFDLPAGFVYGRNRRCGELDVVGQEVILITGLSILEADTAKLDGTKMCFRSSEFNRLITCEALVFFTLRRSMTRYLAFFLRRVTKDI